MSFEYSVINSRVTKPLETIIEIFSFASQSTAWNVLPKVSRNNVYKNYRTSEKVPAFKKGGSMRTKSNWALSFSGSARGSL